MTYTYPGVYIQELPSPVHAITGVATSIAAFVGYTARGIDNRPQVIFSFADFERLYGGLASDSELSYAVAQFYQNAPGAQAYVVRTPRHGATSASVTFGTLKFSALSSGSWTNDYLIIDVDQGPPTNLTSDRLAFNATVSNLLDGTSEYFPNITLDAKARNFAGSVINDPDNGSQLVNVDTSKLESTPNPLVPSGVVGFGITPADLNKTIGNRVSGDWGLVISISTSTPAQAVSVTVFADGTQVPQSLKDIAGQLEQAINDALKKWLQLSGASVQVLVTKASDGKGHGLQIEVSPPNQKNYVLTIKAPSDSTPNDAMGPLGLTTNGDVGHAITPAGLTNTIGKPTTVSGDWGLVISTSSPHANEPGVGVTVFADGTQIPQSLSGVALLLQQTINQALATQLPGASVQVSVTPSSDGNGNGLRIVGSLPKQPDAVLSIAPPSGSTPKDATVPLGLTTAAVTGHAITPADLTNTIGKTTTVSGDWGLVISISSPHPTGPGVSVTVFADGTQIPQSLKDIAGQLEQAINDALASGASVKVDVTDASGGGQGLQITGSLQNQQNAVLTIAAPSGSTLNDAMSPLGLTSTGAVGDAITPASLTNAIGKATTTVSGKWGLAISIPSETAQGVDVTVFADGKQIPQSLKDIAGQLEHAINDALKTSPQLQDASVQVSVSAASDGGGQGLRIVGSLPNQPDVVLSIAPPSDSTLQDATGPLGLTTTGAITSTFARHNVAHYTLGTTHTYASQSDSAKGSDGSSPTGNTEIIGDPGAFTGIYALLKVDLFNLLSIPDATRAMTSDPNALDSTSADPLDPSAIYSHAIALCDTRRAFLLVDPPPDVRSVSGAIDWMTSAPGISDPYGNGAAFWPRLRLPDPLNNYNLRTFAPSGVVAGVYATTDGNRGVWKAPAGINATLNGVQGMTYLMSDQENGLLNPVGLNCLRTFPIYGPVLWGARTLQGADAFTSQWKYVPVRRMALFLEESLYRGTKWVVFEPNDAPLWAAIRLNITSFLQTLFLKGAFQGQTPDQAYFVKCDSETTTQADIDNGIVNILVGFAPLKPAEFVVIQIEQLTGQG